MATYTGPYTGSVTPGSTPDIRELSKLIITKVAVDPQMSNNCYVLRCRATDEQVLIDAADDGPTLLKLLGEAGASKVITTHQHWDHHRALREIAEATGAVVVAGEPDADAITEQTGVPVDDRVRDGDIVEIGEVRLEVIHLVGHTPGSIALLYDDPDGTPHLFTGDSLFPGGVGNTFGDAAAFRSLLHDVRTKLFDRLPDETWFYPGHGDDSTLGAERPHLAEWEERGW
ncbi:MBL fold metallo-hydrolase [Nocardioides pocheonensis]|uniref:MBL fold metallo-hydrolase n=1 Tax=Nocardioides pocheonensis TaxID=661485 RepID=A0A3N0GPY8_9ACTN|nr:MBL fold metallo-hydrolase [Nocardioides pocheonensis]RNM14222.1 MBL fold metallo-hydrolase [Nocardioides pocheonensis]